MKYQNLKTVLRLLLFSVLQVLLSVFVGHLRGDGEVMLLLIMGQGIFVMLFSAFFLIVSLCLCRELPNAIRICYLVLMAAVFVFLPPACVALLLPSHALAAVISVGVWTLLSFFIK